MTNGIFKRLNPRAYARAKTVMSTLSATGFEWSVKLIGTPHYSVGIATELNNDCCIYEDQEAILYFSDGPDDQPYIRRGSTVIHSGVKKLETGDVISFKFLPDTKKLIINWVRNRYSSSTNV